MHFAEASSPWKQWGIQFVYIALLLGCVLLIPLLSVPMAFFMPLLICPVRAPRSLFFRLLLPLAPCTGMLLAGTDFSLCLLLLPCAYLCIGVIRLNRFSRVPVTSIFLLLCLILLGTQALWWLRLGILLGGDLFPDLAEKTVESISQLSNSGNVLMQMVRVGLLALPAQSQNVTGFRLGNLVLLDPHLRIELLNALRFQLESLFRQGIPSLVVQCSLAVSLFTVLRTLRDRNKQSSSATSPVSCAKDREANRQVSPYPSFRTLRLPPAFRGHILLLVVGSFALGLMEGPVPALMSSLMTAAFSSVYQLLGAAVVVHYIGAKRSSRLKLAAILAVVLYLTFPTLLFMLGLADQFLNLRAIVPSYQEEESSS
ncbi:MAG: hypothetical protein FWF86_08030 [Clostridia bacterium]|nr:hypothetical protein [Clostridia bacterium]